MKLLRRLASEYDTTVCRYSIVVGYHFLRIGIARAKHPLIASDAGIGISGNSHSVLLSARVALFSP